MNDYIRSLIYVLDCSSQRLKWYQENPEPRYLDEGKIYFDVANIYMNEINERLSAESETGV